MKTIKYWLLGIGVLLSIHACQKESLPLDPVLNPAISGLVLTVNGMDFTAVPQLDPTNTITRDFLLSVRIPSSSAVVKQISLSDENASASISPGDVVTFTDNELDITVTRGNVQEQYTVTMRYNPPPFMYLIKSSDRDDEGNGYFLNEATADRIASATYDNHYEGYVDLTATNWDNIGLVLSDKTFFYDIDGGWWQGETSGSFEMERNRAGEFGYFITRGPWADWKLTNDNPRVVSPGVWKINFDSETKVMNMLEVQWSITGTAAPDNLLLQYYPEEKIWKSVVDMSTGTFKFTTIPVSFGDPTVTYGVSEGISQLATGGDEIPVNEAGQYEVILNLGTPPFYRFELLKR